MKTVRILLVSLLIGGGFAAVANGQALRERLINRMKEKSVRPAIDPATTVPGATLKTVAYGSTSAEALDIYVPPNAHEAPVVVMVHGGGWRLGDKTSPGVVANKLSHWLPKGYILVSVNYGLLPDVKVDGQADSVARALAYVETHAAEWGGDGKKVILTGHSAGAHLVALLSADPAQVRAKGGHDWRGTVVLDSAALDVASVMSKKHPKLYDDAFGTDTAYWAQLSPSQRLKPGAVPMLLVCSTTRPDDSCGQSRAFADKVRAAGMDAPVLPEALTHMQIDDDLGKPGAYTDSVDGFMADRLK